MIRAAVVGLGRWGRNLVECTQGKTDKIRVAVLEAIVASARSGRPEAIG